MNPLVFKDFATGVYLQDMAPASASPQPPYDRPDIGRRGGEREREQAGEQHEAYGPLDVERHIKDDDRALILYARREHKNA